MARHTSWRAGGAARFYAEPASPEQARALASWARSEGLPLIWAGRGTNMLVRDAGFPGVIAAYRAQSWSLDEAGDTALLRVEAGAPMAGFARRLVAMGWAGLEWAEGLPGSVGGAIFGNAGCYGGDTAGTLHSAEILRDDEVETWPVAQLGYGYRTSILKDDGRWTVDGEEVQKQPHPSAATGPDAPRPPSIVYRLPPLVHRLPSTVHRLPPLVVAGTFRLTRDDPALLAERTAATAAQRKGKTPSGSSCGSVFKNPPGESAGRLIERAGLKGRQVGAALISPLHANYIVNTGGARAAEILALSELAQATVYEQFGIELELEVRVL